jgi:ATP phosphoribosyltransferase regulatory subunit HisZ
VSEGIYSRAKKSQEKQPISKKDETISPRILEELEILRDYRKQLESFMAQLEKAQPKLKELEELVQTTKIVKAVQTDTRDLDKVERDTLIMFQTYLKMQGIVQPSE